MPLFNQITIIGVGLIGGSLAKSIKKNGLANKIVGFFRNKNKLNKALQEKIVDSGCLSLGESIKNSDLAILALPVNQIIKFLPKLKEIIKDKTLIMDVGSTKSQITEKAERLNLNFVGAHPLAGSEKKGFNFSSGTLFNHSLVIITPTKKTDKDAIKKITSFWKKINTNIIVLNPSQHDKILSYTSHLPHLLAFGLINAIPKKYIKFGASGLKDTTRIALSDAQIWSDIILSNKKFLLKSLCSFQLQLEKMAKIIKDDKRNQLINTISAAKIKRESI